MRAGCIIPTPQAIATVPTVNHVHLMAAALSDKIDRSKVLADWQIGDFWNGTLTGGLQPETPDCTTAALADVAIGTALILTGVQPTVVPARVPAFYGRSIGMPGATLDQLAATDGADPLAVLKCAVATGFDVLPQGELVPYPNRVDLSRGGLLSGLRRACLYTAVTLDQRDEQDMLAGRVLDLGGTRGNIVGGHMWCEVDAPSGVEDDTAPVRIVTYGGVVQTTVRWRLARAAASFLLHWEPPITPAGVDLGVDVAAAQGWATA